MNRGKIQIVVLLSAAAFIGGTFGSQLLLETISPNDLREATIDFCQRVNDGRGDEQVTRDVLLSLVTVRLREEAVEPKLLPAFRRARDKLREPVPTISCQKEFSR